MTRSWQDFADAFDAAMAQNARVEAAQALKDGLALAPGAEWLHLRMCSLIELEQGPAAAAEALGKVSQLFPDFAEPRNRQVRALLAADRAEDAERVAQGAAQLFSTDVWVQSTLAAIPGERGDWSEAAHRWRGVRKAFPDHLPAYECELYALMRAGQPDVVEELAVAFAETWPSARIFPQTWADAPLGRLNRYATARRWRAVAAAFPDWADAAYRAAEFFRASGCLQEALDTLHERLDHGAPDSRFVEETVRLNLALGRLEDALTRVEGGRSVASPELVAEVLIACRSETEMCRALACAALASVGDALTHLLGMRAASMAPSWRDDLATAWAASGDGSAEFPVPVSPVHEAGPRASRRSWMLFPDALSSRSVEEFRAAEDLRLIDRLNQFVFDRRVRRYEWDLYRTGTLDLSHSVYAGWHATGSARVLHSSVAFRLTSGSEVRWLMSAGHGTAHCLALVYDPSEDFALATGNLEKGDISVACAILAKAEVEARAAGCEGLVQPAPLLLIGHNNYAHFLWNELSALCEAGTQPASSNLRTAVLYEPYGAIDFAPSPLAEAPEPERYSPQLCFYLSSLTISAEARATALRLSSQGQQKVPTALPDRNPRSLWISLRLMYRHPINQLDFCRALIEEVGRTEGCYRIYLDGFSLPEDVGIPGRYAEAYLRSQAALVTDVAAQLTAISLPVNVEVVDVTGASLAAATTMGAGIDSYVCSQGTQQHKLAWIYDIPGVIHSSAYLADASPSGEWVQVQCGFESEATIMPADLVVDVERQNERQDHPSFRNYAFRDPAAAAAWTVAALVLSERREGTSALFMAKLSALALEREP